MFKQIVEQSIGGIIGGVIVVFAMVLLGGSQMNFAGTTHLSGITINGTDSGDGLIVGEGNTAFAGVVAGSCTIWAGAQTIAATSTQQIVCQSATNGSLSSSLTGVTSDSICNLVMASSTNTTIGSLVVGGVSASSTAGNIVARLINLTGTTFTWDAVASSSAKWKYSCFDPL